MKTAAIKILSFALISGIMLSAVGCRRTVKIAGNGSDYASEYWITEEVDGENTASGGKTDGKGSTASSKDTGSKPEKKFTPSKNKLTVEGAGTDPDADYKASGTVKVAVSSYRPCD